MTAPRAHEARRAWLDARTAGGPPVLRDRVLEHAAMIEEGGTAAEQVALAAERVLAIVEEHPGDRGIALDLLAADALITLALLAQAEADPERLGAFTEGLLAAERIV
ncbi:MAG: hypothetical protein SF070_18800 [Gemmatimonadota bacterium]|nr:hypothetical protein [Gemmatimonadota bacterium]